MFFFQKSLELSGRSQPKSGSRQEGAPPDVDMEEAPPPMSDGDVCMPATSQSPYLASAAVSAGFLAFLFCLSSTHLSESRSHLIFLKRLPEYIICSHTCQLDLILSFLSNG